MIELTKLQDKEIQEIDFENSSGNSYCCLQENFLYCMIMDDEKGNRDKAIGQIFFRRLNPKTVLMIDFDCKCWNDLVKVCQIEVEPPTTIVFHLLT